jgi:hypothetical protein
MNSSKKGLVKLTLVHKDFHEMHRCRGNIGLSVPLFDQLFLEVHYTRKSLELLAAPIPLYIGRPQCSSFADTMPLFGMQFPGLSLPTLLSTFS